MKHINVVAAIIRDGDRIFATQRGYGEYKDFWEFPGGKIEEGETPETALKREIMEELDTEIDVGTFLCTVDYDYPAFHITLHCYFCSVISGNLTLKEHESARWLSLSDLDTVNWLPADLEVIKKSTEVDDNPLTTSEVVFIRQINDGLRAKLEYQSIVTGMLYVELDYFANPGDKYVLHNRSGNVLEIPVAPSGLADLAKKVEDTILEVAEIDFKEMAANLNKLIVNANSKVEQLDAAAINKKLNLTLDNLQKISGDERIMQTLDNLNKLLSDGDIFIKDANSSIKQVSKDASLAMGKFAGVLDELDAIVSPNSPFRYELSLLMKSFGDAAISVKALADYIERNPNSLLIGKPTKNKQE